MTTEGSTDVRHPTPRWVQVGLVVLLVWAGAVRVWLASTGLETGHYWDERYSVKNVRAVLENGSLEPVNYYYPSLSYLPQAAVLATIEAASRAFDDTPFSFFAGGPFHPNGYLLARLLQVGYGLGTIVLTFLLGRRLISAEAGLAAAIFLAVAPQHVRLSTMWKPDITLLFAILLTLWWTLDALDRPSLRRYLLAGAGVGLALASKLNGGPIAAPLALGAAIAGFHDRRHWRGLIAAGAAAVVVFVALNPQVGRYLDALERNRKLYAGHAAGPDPAPLDRLATIAREEIGFVVSTTFHGLPVGVIAIAGMAWVSFDAVRRRNRQTALRALAIVVFPLAYTAIYALETSYAKENNFLQILPFTALAAALPLDALWSRLARSKSDASRWAAATAAVALAVLVAAPTQAWLYRAQVRVTWDLAIDAVAEQLLPWNGRVAYVEAPQRTLAGQPRDLKALLRAVDDLDAVPPDLLDQADAELFPASRLDEAEAHHQARAARVSAVTTRRFEARWFRARGPAVIAILHSREPAGIWTSSAARREDGLFTIDLPRGTDAALLSAEIWRRRSRKTAAAPEILLGEQPLRLHARAAGRQTGWLTERFPASAATLVVRVPAAGEGESELPVRIYGWK